MMRIFIGVDKRQPIAYHVLAHSLMVNSTLPLSITPLILSTLPIYRRGLTDFTFSRYLVPWLCDYKGTALFMDADMLVMANIRNLLVLQDESPVMIVKNPLRFEWPSLMLFNNEKCTKLTPEYIETGKPQTFEWADSIGELPQEWNHCVGYDNAKGAKIAHFTQGIPIFEETKDCDYATEWRETFAQMNSSVSWQEIMGHSIHAKAMGR